jgi:hypothetical protein
MKIEQLKRIFEFLEEKEEHNMPFNFKLLNNEPLTKRDLNIEGSLYLATKNITSLPKGLKIRGSLNLISSNITSLPEGLKVGGNLDLAFSSITLLPKDLKVGGHLDLIETDIKFLPKGLEVGRNLYIDDSALIKYSAEELREMIKPGFIKGEIYR